MDKHNDTGTAIVKTILWAAIIFSSFALFYHIRWFIPFLLEGSADGVVNDSTQFVGFLVQIFNNCIFLFTGYQLLKLFRKYQQTGFFDMESLKVFNCVIVSCVGLSIAAAVQTVSSNFQEVHFSDWTSAESIANLAFRSFTRLLLFKDPQTMYLLIAVILWCVKQFVAKALFFKTENEAFV